MTTGTKVRVLFTGIAPVHYLCFRPLHERLMKMDGVEVQLSGGVERQTEMGTIHDQRAMYGRLPIPPRSLVPVEEIQERDYDFLFAGNTTLVRPRSVETTVQIFHGISFRNRAIRTKNMGCDKYFLVGPYMKRRFAEVGLLQPDDPRAVDIGFMKTDALLDGSLERRALLDRFGFDGSRPVVAYAPTGQKKNSLEVMGEAVLEKLAAANRHDVLVKLHDHPKNEIDWPSRLARFEGPHLRLVTDMDVMPVLAVSDLLISDASSVSNEYTLLDRPMVFLDVPKLLARQKTKDESMLDLETWGRKGGVVVGDPKEVVDVVDECLRHPNEQAAVRQAMVRDLFFNPGRATDAAVEWFRSAAGLAGSAALASGQ